MSNSPRRLRDSGTDNKSALKRDIKNKADFRRKILYRTVTVSMLVAAAMVLSYVESLIPPIVPIPGVKIGLANSVTLFALYSLGIREAGAISLVRVCLSALLFGNAVGLLYSASGAVLSFVMMVLLSRSRIFSCVGVSVVGGVAHNVGQVLAAMAVMQTAGLITYLAPLLISGVIAGAIIGILSGILIKKTKFALTGK
jgi:heptaprenyl diphosphate synthase